MVVKYVPGERYPGKSRSYVLRTPYERCVLLLLLPLNCLSSFTRTISRQVHFEERRASRSGMLLCSAPKHCVFAPKPCLHFLPAGLFDAVVWLEKYVLWQGAQKHTHVSPPLGWLVGWLVVKRQLIFGTRRNSHSHPIVLRGNKRANA